MSDAENRGVRAEHADPVSEERARHTADMLTLEMLFLGFVALVVLVAFIDALGYAFVSARTPFVIMVPLALMIALQARRLYRRRAEADAPGRLRSALAGHMPSLTSATSISIWMAALFGLIMTLGHYVGIFGFCYVLIRRLGRESLKMALIVSAATVAAIYGIFEVGFNIELYRGLVIRYFLGYRDF